MKRLSDTEIHRIFGSFEFSEAGDGRIKIDPSWIRGNIVTLSFPIVGSVSCHRLVKDQLKDAFRELEEDGLSHLVDVDDFRWNGGCFVQRHTKLANGNYLKSPSRHSFGVAIDINPAAYPCGSTRQQPKALRDIFSKWGFEVVVEKDPMHFEFVRFATEEGGRVLEAGRTGKSLKGKEEEDMAGAFRAYQSEKPEKDCFIEGLYTGKNNFGLGRVFLIVRVEKGRSYPAQEGDAKVRVYVIPEDASKKIETHSFDRVIPADNRPSVFELPKIGGFSLHIEVQQGSPVLCAVNQHYS